MMRKIVIQYERSMEIDIRFLVEIPWHNLEVFGIVEVQLLLFQLWTRSKEGVSLKRRSFYIEEKKESGK